MSHSVYIYNQYFGRLFFHFAENKCHSNIFTFSFLILNFQLSLVLTLSYIYDSGSGAIEFIICHAEVSIAFAEEKKIPEVHLLKLSIS